MPRRLLLALTAAALFASPFAGVAAQARPFLPSTPIFTEYDHAAQLTHRTYSWGDLRLEVPQYGVTIRSAIDKNLAARGWQLVATGGSATIFGIGNVRGEIQMDDFYKSTKMGWAQDWGVQGWGPGWKPFYGELTSNGMSTPESHLVVDILDTGSHNLLFRGVMATDFSTTPAKITKKFNKSLKKMFQKFPPKG